MKKTVESKAVEISKMPENQNSNPPHQRAKESVNMTKTLRYQIENAVRDAATGINQKWTVRLFADGSIETTHDDYNPEDEHIVIEQSEKMDWQDFIEDCMAEQVEARQKKCKRRSKSVAGSRA